MKLPFLKHVSAFVFVATGLVLINTSCSKKDNILEDPTVETPISVPDGDLFANFNWSTTKTVNLRLAVDDEYSGQYSYKLEIFDREPHLENAVLLGAGLAKKGQDLVTKIIVPTSLTHVFVQKTTPQGEVSYSIIEASNADFSVSGNKASNANFASINTSGIALRASTTPVSSTVPVVPAIPSNALSIHGNSTISTIPASKAFVINAGETFAGDIPALNAAGNEGVVVYVQGKWHHSRAIDLGNSNKIVVLPGGELNVSALNLNGGSASYVNHGDLLLKDLKINANNSFFNVGTLKVTGTVTMIGKAEFVNYQKDVKVKIGALTMSDTEAVATNNGEIEILNGTFTNGTLNANCYTTVGTMSATNATVNVWSQAMLDVTNLRAEGTTFNLFSKSVLDVTREATFKAGANNKSVVINSLSTDPLNKSYVRIKYVRVDASNAIHLSYNGYIIVVTDEHPRRSENRFTTNNGTDVEIFWDRYNHPPYVAATSCNAGGAGVPPTNPPVDQKLEEVKLGTYSYLFEDNWPKQGDYDLNDFVLSVEVIKYQNQSNKVEKVVLKNKIYALGATRRVAAAIQLDNILANTVKSVTYSDNNVVGTTIPLVSGVGIESNQSKAVVTIVDDAHKAFGLTSSGFVFTHNGAYSPFETTITIEFNTPLDVFSFDDLNPFIISSLTSSPGKRHEVHLVGHNPTDKIDTKVIIDNQVAGGTLSSTDPFKTSDGWPFAIVVPTAPFQYQRTEGQHISVAYPKFMDWVTSGGTQSQDWYNYPKN